MSGDFRSYLVYFALLLLSVAGFSQSPVVITGKVTSFETKEPLTGVSIVEKGTLNGVVSDVNGHYTVEVEGDSSRLVFSFVGYHTEEIEVGTFTEINIEFQKDISDLDEIVVIGYGGIKRKEVTGAVSTIKSKEILNTASSDLGQTLQGQIAGVSVYSSGGGPGGQANVQIRGVGSFTATSINPLYVIDGIPQSEVPNITPEEVESISILKDGASAAAYGTRASNGVILIETKKGGPGPLRVSYSSYYGIQNITSSVPLMNTQQHLFAYEQEIQNNYGSSSNIFLTNQDVLKNDNDFVEYLTKNNAPVTNHTLTFSGGKDDSKIHMLTNYFSQDGVVKNSGYKSISTRINGELEKERISMSSSIGVKLDNQKAAPRGIYESAIIQRPYYPLPDQPRSSIIIDNPVFYGQFASQLSNEDIRKNNAFNVAFNMQYEILPGLKYRFNAGSDILMTERTLWLPQYYFRDNDGEIVTRASRSQATLRKDRTKRTKWTLENVLSYDKQIGSHSIKTMVAYTSEQIVNEEERIEKADFLSNDTPVFSAGNIPTLINGDKRELGLTGLLGRVIYSYREKYLMSFVMRRDGSSNFGPGYKKKTFYGGSVGCNLHETYFLHNVSLINVFKIRASIGEVGNQNIPPYQFTTAIVPGSNYHFGSEGQETIETGATQRSIANKSIKWETNLSKNIGLDLTMFSGKFVGVFDIYHNSKKDMLIPIDLPPSFGTWIPRSDDFYRTYVTNVGDMINKGVEITLGYSDTKGDFIWSVSGTYFKNINQVISLPESYGEYAVGGGQPILYTSSSENTTFIKPGEPVPTFMLVPTNGIIKSEDELKEYEGQFITSTRSEVGDLRWVDSNGDGVSDARDRVPCGSPLPKFEAGLNLNTAYRNFELFVQLFYSHGSKIYNGAKALAYQQGRHADLYYQWLPSNPGSDVPSMRFNPQHRNMSTMTDYYLEDGTYFRVRNLTFGYNLPRNLLTKIKLEKVKLYINLQNPITLTKYTGFDPEVGYNDFEYNGEGDAFFSFGVDRGNYPVARKFLVGLQVEF